MPTITDWLTVAITFIYVIATIIICVSNKKSADLSREALALSREQFEESSRLSVIPFLQIEKKI